MYKGKVLKRIDEIIGEIAKKHQIPEEEIRKDMMAAIDIGRSNPDSSVQEKWAEYDDGEMTLEEFILWMASQLVRRSG